MGAPSRGGSRSSLPAGARSIARGSLEKTKLPGFEEPETLVPMTRVSASSTAASPLPGSAVRLSRRCCAIPAPGPSSHGSPAAQRVLQGGYRCSSFLLSPFSRGSGTWRFRSAWATGARRGPVRSAHPFTVAPERLSSLPTGGDGVRGGRARTPAHGRGCRVCPQPGVKRSGVPGAARCGGRQRHAGTERACPDRSRGANGRAAASL